MPRKRSFLASRRNLHHFADFDVPTTADDFGIHAAAAAAKEEIDGGLADLQIEDADLAEDLRQTGSVDENFGFGDEHTDAQAGL